MDLANCYSEKWIEYPHAKGVSFLLRYYPEEKRLELLEKHTSIKAGGEKVIDYVAFGIDAVEHMLRDWKGIKLNGKTANCSSKNKQILVTRDTKAGNWIATTCQLEMVFHDKISEVLKNFSGLLNTDDNGRKREAVTEVE
jgi:hypothetical protein